MRDALIPAQWPDAVALDETKFDLTITDTDDQGDKTSHTGSVSVLGVYGYPAGLGTGRAVRLAARGGEDKVEWAAVLREREGKPTWVVCDQGKAVMAAVKRAWPNATIYVCEAHLRRLGEARLAADGFDRFHPLWKSLRKAIPERDGWEAFEQEVEAAGAAQTLRVDPRQPPADGTPVGDPTGRSAALDRRPRDRPPGDHATARRPSLRVP